MKKNGRKAQAPLHDTKNDLSQKNREAMIELLQARLADAIDLASQAKQAHWNVKGPQFIALHELFDKVHGELDEYVDELAERLVALGGTAFGTIRMAAGATQLPEYPAAIHSGPDHVDAMSSALAAFGKSIRAAIDAATESDDAGTADLFTQVSRAIDKSLWFVEAHQQAER